MTGEGGGMADALDLGSSAFGRGGSNPPSRTMARTLLGAECGAPDGAGDKARAAALPMNVS